MRIDVVSLLPNLFSSYLSDALPKWAADEGRAEFHLHDLNPWLEPEVDQKRRGPRGRVIPATGVIECVRQVERSSEQPSHLVLLSPTGRMLDQAIVRELADCPRLILLCGRRGGFDDRLGDALHPDEISVGNYVLSGGEPAAMVLIDAVLRLVPGVLPTGALKRGRPQTFEAELRSQIASMIRQYGLSGARRMCPFSISKGTLLKIAKEFDVVLPKGRRPKSAPAPEAAEEK